MRQVLLNKKTAAALALLLSLTQLAGCDKAIQEADGQNSENALTESGGNENETETESAAETETSGAENESESAAEAETDEEPQSEDISDDPQLITLRERIRQSGLPVGLAYIGYIGNDASEEELRNLVADSAYAAPYAFLKNAPIVGAEGAELYAVVTMADCAISVYPISLADDGALTADGDILRQSDGGDCFLLRCNVSDIVPNIECEIKSGKLVYTLSPMLSGMDGYLTAPGVCDFTIYPEEDKFSGETGSARTERDIEIATELLSEAAEVQERLGEGMTLLYTGEEVSIDGRDCMLFALGTDSGEQFVTEYFYSVCDNLIYAYDALSDTWNVLGMG